MIKALIIIICVLVVLLAILIISLRFTVKKKNLYKQKSENLEKQNKTLDTLIKSIYDYLREIQKIEEWEKNFYEKAKNKEVSLRDIIFSNNERVSNK